MTQLCTNFSTKLVQSWIIYFGTEGVIRKGGSTSVVRSSRMGWLALSVRALFTGQAQADRQRRRTAKGHDDRRKKEKVCRHGKLYAVAVAWGWIEMSRVDVVSGAKLLALVAFVAAVRTVISLGGHIGTCCSPPCKRQDKVKTGWRCHAPIYAA